MYLKFFKSLIFIHFFLVVVTDVMLPSLRAEGEAILIHKQTTYFGLPKQFS